MNDVTYPLRIGTRASPLALAQADMVGMALRQAHGLPADAVSIVEVRTTGDAVQDRPLAEIGGKALWTKEIDAALLSGKIDMAVHSMKDVETVRPPAIGLAATLRRADVRDRLIGSPSLEELPIGATVGTSSPRRAAQVRHLRPDVVIRNLRGNVGTRLAAVESGAFSATLLAAAGLDRLGLASTGNPVPLETALPALQQGAVGIEALLDRTHVWAMIAAINDEETHRCVEIERMLLGELGAGCHSPAAGLASGGVEGLTLRAELLSPCGRHRRRASALIAWDAAPKAFVRSLAEELLIEAPAEISSLFQANFA